MGCRLRPCLNNDSNRKKPESCVLVHSLGEVPWRDSKGEQTENEQKGLSYILDSKW